MKIDINISYTNRDDVDIFYYNQSKEYGGFKDSVETYGPNIISTLNFPESPPFYPQTKYLERAKIIRPAYGQRSTYQAEYPTNTFPKYYYKNHGNKFSQYSETLPGGETVSGIMCDTLIHQNYKNTYILDTLIENCEQVDWIDTLDHKWDASYYYSDNKKQNEWKWYIKPRMRIDTAVANNINMQNIVVVNLVVKNFEGDSISIPILVSNFKKTGQIYDGKYIDMYYDGTNLLGLTVTGSFLHQGANPYPNPNYMLNSKVDYKIYWPGNVNVWLDYVRLDDEWAHFLFNPWLEPDPKQYDFIEKIKDEVNLCTQNNNFGYFYMDEVPFNSFPCIAEVNRLIDSLNTNSHTALFPILMKDVTMTDFGRLRNQPSDEQYLDYILEMKNFITDVFLNTVYPFDNSCPYPSIFAHPDSLGTPSPVKYTQATSPANYNDNLMNHGLEHLTRKNGEAMKTYRMMGNMLNKSKLLNKDLLSTFFIQVHNWESEIGRGNDANWYNLREPTNEEIRLQGYLAMIYGVKQIHYFSYNSDTVQYNDKIYGNYGLMANDSAITRRENNYYGQKKWLGIIATTEKLKAIGNVLYPAGDRNNHLIYKESRTVNQIVDNPDNIPTGLPILYIDDIRSNAPNISGTNGTCVYDNYSEYFDCPDERYWELGFFDQPSGSTDGISKYFIALNKRSTPDTLSGYGIDTRILKIKFKLSDLAGYNNWMIKDAVTNEVISTFDKNYTTYVYAGEYKPAEAKLLKLIPVFKEGGTLAGDETLSGNINCKGMVYNGGKNITISPATTISFDSLSGIEMNGGNFTCGEYNSDNPVTLKGKDNNSHTWKGLLFSDCLSIGIYKTNISKIQANDTAKGVMIYNCNNINIKRSTFNMGTNAGAIQAIFTWNTDDSATFNISECNFYMGNSGYDAISITSNASYTLPVIIDWCNFTTTNENSFALRLIGVTGGAIKNSTFVNYETTLNAMGSAIDLYGNKMLGNNDSKGIECSAGSQISLSPTSGQYLGGYNYIKNYGSSSSNVYSINSYFNINNGQNDFDIDDLDNSKHLTGTFSGQQQLSVNAIKNCFHKDSTTNIDATHTVIWNSSSDPVNFIFTDYSCELIPPGDYFVYQYGGYNDTVYYSSGGEGGGFNPNKPMNIEENVYKSLKDTININLRKRNYLTVEDKAKQLLTLFPDSLESSGAVQKLYMASLSLDSSKIGITKTFLENLIASNAQNPILIKRAFYFIQKCKVKLKQYQSALDGFQYIMTQNPYTYEGLVASWDYAATYLLMGSGGSYKGDNEEQSEELNTPVDTLLNRMTKRDINTNKNTNTTANEQITKTFYEKIKNVTKDDKTAQEEKIKTLEKKIETTKNKTEKSDAVTELATMKQIKEVVKLKKPNTIVTHTAIINSDIKKVFGIGKGNKDETTNSLIPQNYALYQNYPNPFNPTTKIAYDLPRDAKVKLVIYDILGREMKTLVNNEFRSAGKYITEFNGSNLASGIYFARILVNEGKDFMAVKKMVLVK
ncbi:MAG: T9SS type A sorting domain-containing protein [Ignavibacteria bacterium]|nr:T9SS type A sorting domain-containing protein [Ignavibacteria bacterium]